MTKGAGGQRGPFETKAAQLNNFGSQIGPKEETKEQRPQSERGPLHLPHMLCDECQRLYRKERAVLHRHNV